MDRFLELLRLARQPGLCVLHFPVELRTRSLAGLSVLLQRFKGETQVRGCFAGLTDKQTQPAIELRLGGCQVSLSNARRGPLQLFGDLRDRLVMVFSVCA